MPEILEQPLAGAGMHQARSQGGAAGRPPPPPPPWRPGGPFSARAACRKGPTRPREAQFLESLEVLRATRALSERPEGPMDVQRAPVQVRGPLVRLKGPFGESEGPFERSGRGPFEAPPPPPPPWRNPGYVPGMHTLQLLQGGTDRLPRNRGRRYH